MTEPVILVALMAAQLLQGTAMLALAGIALRRADAGSAPRRAAIAASAFLATALMPLAVILPQHLTVTLGTEKAVQFQGSAFGMGDLIVTAPRQELCGFLVALWLAVAALRLMRTLAAALAGERLVRGAVPIDADRFGLAGVRIAVSTAVNGPLVAGLIRPTILLPPRLLSAPELPLLLRHEHAHLMRNDLAADFGQRLVEDVLWWNWPLRRLGVLVAEQREIACDEHAAAGTAPTVYARALIGEAHRHIAAGPLHAGLQGGVERRLERLAGRRGALWMPAAIVLAVAALVAVAATPRLNTNGATHIGIASN